MLAYLLRGKRNGKPIAGSAIEICPLPVCSPVGALNTSTHFDRLRWGWLPVAGAVEAQVRRSRAFPGSRWGLLAAGEGLPGRRPRRSGKVALANLPSPITNAKPQ